MPPTELRYRLPQSMGLHGKNAFDAVFAARMRKPAGPLVLHSRPNALGHNRLGLAVPRKVGNAVRRNQIKRHLREAFRLNQHDLAQGYDLVVLVRPHEALSLAQYADHLRQAVTAADRGWQKRMRCK